MKTPFLLLVQIIGLVVVLAGQVTAQTFTTLHNFTMLSGISYGSNSDGASPSAALILSGETLYGTAHDGGNSLITDYAATKGNGTIFRVNTDGTGFASLHTFTAGFGDLYYFTNHDGANPPAGLVLSSNTLYGTASRGGSWDNGTVFKVNIDGTGFTVLHSFSASDANPLGLYTNTDGATPKAGLILSGNTLYGTTTIGGSAGEGTVFAVNTDGTGFINLHSFTALPPDYANSDGAGPEGGLIISGNTLYGTARYGGTSDNGTVFKLNIDGTEFMNLHNFAGGSDGVNPHGGLTLSGNTLYGTTIGLFAKGTVFAVNTDGAGFTNLHSFTTTPAGSTGPNSDGSYPFAGLLLFGKTLYGTACYGGSSGNGTVYKVNTGGTGFANLHNFNTDGAYPAAALILSGNTLYGTASGGGSFGNGTVFSLTLPGPQLTLSSCGPNLILTWPTNVIDLILQASTNLGPSAIWTTNCSAPVVVNGQYAVTNPISGTQQFFRLSRF